MQQVTVENFRCFRETQRARLAPLTLLVGENSTGKTSFLALLRTLDSLFHARDFDDFQEPPYDLGSFDEVAHYRGGRGGRADSFTASIDYVPVRRPRGRKLCRLEVTFIKDGAVPVPARQKLVFDLGWVEVTTKRCAFGTAGGAWQTELPRELRSRHGSGLWQYRYLWRETAGSKWAPAPTDRSAQVERSEPTEADLKALTDMLYSVPIPLRVPHAPYASAPMRSRPRRTYNPGRQVRDPEGDYIPMYLSGLHFQDQNAWTGLRASLEHFGREAGLFDEIAVRALGKGATEPFQLQIRKLGTQTKGPRRNLIDVGYGVSQVLPVLTELMRPEAPRLFLLQQPEVHLHPSAQAALGSLFCRIAGPRRQLIVETHSDHLLDRVRMDVRDGKGNLKPEDVSILFFERNDIEVNIHSLSVDDCGNIHGAPPSYRRFFLEETTRSLVPPN